MASAAARPALVIGNRNTSSWSLRPWLALRHAGIPFDEIPVRLRQGEATKAAIAVHSPTGKVPVLKLADGVIPETIAIIEWANEEAPEARLLPASPLARALCRAAGAEMHAGFVALRNLCPMDIAARLPAPEMTPELNRDIARIETLWSDCRGRFGADGPYLFGHFTLADAMFAPVATRFETYGIPLGPVARRYVETIYDDPQFRIWHAAALAEVAAHP